MGFRDRLFRTPEKGQFDAASLQRLVRTLEGIKCPDGPTINRRVVSLLWYIPLFMEWQRERVQESGGNVAAFVRATNQVQALVQEILGVP